MEPEGLLFLVGGIIPQIGFWSPFAARLYGRLGRADRLDERVAFVEAHRFWWHEHNVGFAVGALTVAAGFVAMAGNALMWTAAACAGAGAAMGAIFATRRTRTPPREWFTRKGGTVAFVLFSVLTILAFVLLGFHFLEGHTGLAIFVFTWNALLVAVLLWLRDLPPFAHFVGAIVVGVVLLW